MSWYTRVRWKVHMMTSYLLWVTFLTNGVQALQHHERSVWSAKVTMLKIRPHLINTLWFGLVCFGLVWLGLFCFGLVWFGLIWFGLVWFLSLMAPSSIIFLRSCLFFPKLSGKILPIYGKKSCLKFCSQGLSIILIERLQEIFFRYCLF